MNRLDTIAASIETKYSIEYKKDMPDKLDGLCVGRTILINANKPAQIQAQALVEELAHQETTIGNIVGQGSIAEKKQEYKARRIAYESVIPLNSLINAYWRSTSEYELADNLDVTKEFLEETLNYYRVKYGTVMEVNNQLINFANGIQIVDASN
ncbi:ImmA/IrrE family metallo-endopeptidase [Latilactobacillus sakei]|uniref:ImmA/IrrE family metallo-endopeptidase n=1 Tax=Latilactobacillus sakei TaxID=1599 RepID=UPI000FFC0EDD|nr:ImmA/IrrE family metallo-endopeptidase [Latilactobacillus sakei]QMU86676.1 ImmA/IrrE family metallo-endopeptidase [Latilactobacillus sakei]RXA82604.1 ImmA/IrrE family metallo-endopeptidase [Latilactobacillus sakei]